MGLGRDILLVTASAVAGVLLYTNLGPQLIQFILTAVTFGLVVALLLMERKGFGDINLLDCTCHRDGGVTCGYHDTRLLRNLSKKISSPELLFDLGLELRIPRYSIETYIENNKGSINQAAFDVVHKVWYEKQDGLGPNSRGRRILQQALNNTGQKDIGLLTQ